MDRRLELDDCLKEIDINLKKIISPLLDEVIFLEGELAKLKKLPQLRIHPNNPLKQEITPAAKLYKDYVSRYNDIIYKIGQLVKKSDCSGEDSPLRKYVKEFKIGKSNDSS